MASQPSFDWHLAEWMASKKISQADLVRLTGFPKAKVSELVNGKSRYNRDVVNVISSALHIRPFELLMHPDDANRLARLRETALTIAAENPSYGDAPNEKMQVVRKS